MILVVTQKVDRRDSNLGFFHHWLAKLGRKDSLIVIANEVGEYVLPAEVKVFSLGKERGYSRLRRFLIYQSLLWRWLPKCQGVFFHMCPEYVLAAGWWSRFFGKRTLLWYTHKAVNCRLKVAERLVDKIFTASEESFRLLSKKVEITGHGIDTDFFPAKAIYPTEIRLLSVGRIAPIKHLEVLIQAAAELKKIYHGSLTFNIVGSPLLSGDQRYCNELKALVRQLNLLDTVYFLGPKNYEELPTIYNRHQIFLHASETGSIDKAVLEALSSGLMVFTSSEAYLDLKGTVVEFSKADALDLARKIEDRLSNDTILCNHFGREYVQNHYSLDALLNRILDFF